MKTLNKILYTLFIFFLIGCQPVEVYFENTICIENIHIIDPVLGEKPNQTVIIKEGKIHKIVDSKTLQLSKKNNIIDGSNKYLIPGLWDTHVHFSFIEELAPRMFDLFLSHGITSVRDTGGKLDFVKKWKDMALINPTSSPRVMMAGPLIDGKPIIYNGSDAMHPELSVGVTSLDDLTTLVSSLIKKDVDFLKAYEMLTPEQFIKLNELARKNSIKITGHVPLSMDVISASNAGLNSIEHLRNLEFSCASNSEELLIERRKLLENENTMTGGKLRSYIHSTQREKALENYNEKEANKVLDVLKKNDTWQIPTLVLNTLFTGKYFADSTYQKSYTKLPDSLGQYWLKRSKVLTDYPVTEFQQKFDDWSFMMVKKIHKKGIPIMAGTDTPIAYLTPGLSLHKELQMLAKAGLSEIEVLKTATINPAKYFNMEDKLGSIQEGMWADLLILNDNPLEDISNTQKIETVIKQGKIYNSK